MLKVTIAGPGNRAAGLLHSTKLDDNQSQGFSDSWSLNRATVPSANPLPVTLTTVPPSVLPALG